MYPQAFPKCVLTTVWIFPDDFATFPFGFACRLALALLGGGFIWNQRITKVELEWSQELVRSVIPGSSKTSLQDVIRRRCCNNSCIIVILIAWQQIIFWWKVASPIIFWNYQRCAEYLMDSHP
jgi:hypothetical protein